MQYGCGCTRRERGVGQGCRFRWSQRCRRCSMFDASVRLVVGDERMALFWTDSWIDGYSIKVLALHSSPPSMRVLLSLELSTRRLMAVTGSGTSLVPSVSRSLWSSFRWWIGYMAPASPMGSQTASNGSERHRLCTRRARHTAFSLPDWSCSHAGRQFGEHGPLQSARSISGWPCNVVSGRLIGC